MLKIGDFSRLTQVPVKTLRYYDEIDLLKPAEIDRYTGYRYYATAQMAVLHRILVLKDLGFSLGEIRQLLEEVLSPAEMRAMLLLKRTQVERQIAEEQTLLMRIEDRMQMIEREGQMPANEVVIKSVEPIRVLSYREVVAGPQCISPFFLAVDRALQRQAIQPCGAWMALYHQGEYREVDLDLEAAIPVTDAITKPVQIEGERWLTLRTLPGCMVASTICRMTCQADVYESNRALSQWVEDHEVHFVSGACREVYHEQPQPSKPVFFEIQIPVEQSA